MTAFCRALVAYHLQLRQFACKRRPLVTILYSHISPGVVRKSTNRTGYCSYPVIQRDRMYSSKPPCKVGDSLNDIETPALVVCLDRLEQNINKMAEMMKTKYPSVAYRAHAKTHKCPMIAWSQIKCSANGICCQTLSEAEAMVESGIPDVFISNQVIAYKKLLRVAGLAKRAEISVCVDSEENIENLSKAACEMGTHLKLVVEINQNRCGVEPGPDVARLAKKIIDLPNLTFKGLHSYMGSNQHIRSTDDRKAAVDLVVQKTKVALKALEAEGINCSYVTGGGTGTFKYEATSGLFTEVQPGSYIFMDADYGRNLDESGKPTSEFLQSLYVLSTVQSVNPGTQAVLDTGLKGVSLDSGVPLVSGSEDLVYHNGGDEHGIIKPSGNLKVGELVWLIPGHCDPTVNMHDWIVGLRNGKVESVWPICGRGPGI